MSETSNSEVRLWEHIVAACERFEEAWRSGSQPRIEDELTKAADHEKTTLLRELIALERELRQKRGEKPSPDDYRSRFAGHPELIEEIFRSDTINEAVKEGDVTPGDASRSASASSGARFRVIRPHARGGLGEVFVARDEELKREVALKEIQLDRAFDPASRARFVQEAEITGGLEHPGIVPVYGLGTYSDGRPYYAMRFISGENLSEAIRSFHADEALRHAPDRRILKFRNLFRRFVDVCNALEYAHSQGVLHRDIQPGNIIVGNYGETLLVDWGLAKAAGRVEEISEASQLPASGTGAETLPGSPIGTPAYMSPEQANGELDRLGPRSDVYSLGATLYCLLTGKAPFSGMDILSGVKRGEFSRPRSLEASIDTALEAICLKAMSLQPEDRYNSPRALADDVERWMADEAVLAWREPFSRRLNRWAKRNRTAVTAATAAVLVGLVGLSALAAIQAKANRDLKDEQSKTRLALIGQEKATNRSEKREQMAIDVLKKFRDIFEDEPALKTDPTLDDLRKRLMSEPLIFFRNLREALLADEETSEDSLKRLGDTSYELGLVNASLGKISDALTAHRESLQIRQKLTDGKPSVARYQQDLANSYQEIGLLLGSSGRQDDAMKSHRSGMSIRRKLVESDPSSNDFQNDLAASHGNIANLLKAVGKFPEAIKEHEAALTIRRKLVEVRAENTTYQSGLAISYNNLGNLFGAMGKSKEAIDALESALMIRRKLVSINPKKNSLQSDLGTTHNNLAFRLFENEETDKALKEFAEALTIQKKLVATMPSSSKFWYDLAQTRNNIGRVLAASGRPKEALAEYEEALNIRKKLTTDYPMVLNYQSDLAVSYSNIGTLLKDSGKTKEALVALKEAIAVQRPLAKANPSNMDIQSRFAVFLMNIGTVHADAGESSDALAAYDEALVVARKLTEAVPSSTDYPFQLAYAYFNVGDLQRHNGKLDEAIKAYDSALTIWRKLNKEHPGVANFESNLGETLDAIAAVEITQKRYKKAGERLPEASNLHKHVLRNYPTNIEFRKAATIHWNNMLNLARELGDIEGVAAAERELKAVTASDPAKSP